MSLTAVVSHRLHYRHAALVLCVSAYFAVRFAQLVVSPVVPRIIDEFAVSRGAVGFAFAGMWATYALSQLPSGVLGDRFGERRVVLTALGVTTLVSLAVAGSPTPLAFLGFVVFLGVGAGLYYNAATALLTRLFGEVGAAIGVHRVGGQVAGLVAPVAATAALAYGWRASVATGAAATAALFLAFAAAVRPVDPVDPDASLRDEAALGTLVALLRRREVATATAVAVCGEFVALAAMSFLPTFLTEHYSLGIGTAGLLFSGYYAVVAVSQPVSGRLSDRVGRDATLALAMAAGVGGFALLAGGQAAPTLLPALGLAGFAMSWATPLQSRVMDDLDAVDRGVGFGLVRTLYILSGAVGNAVVGTLADAAGWSAAFGLLGGVFGVGLLVLLGDRLTLTSG